MKSTGIIKRIDELGRIVIPKEIRKNMHIKPGELFEIYLFEEDSLVLKRYNTINKKNNILQELINISTIKNNFNIFITDFNKVVFSNRRDIENEKLSEEMDLNKTAPFLHLTQNYIIDNSFSLYNLCVSGDLIGYIIFEYKTKNINKDLENVILNIVETCLENK